MSAFKYISHNVQDTINTINTINTIHGEINTSVPTTIINQPGEFVNNSALVWASRIFGGTGLSQNKDSFSISIKTDSYNNIVVVALFRADEINHFAPAEIPVPSINASNADGFIGLSIPTGANVNAAIIKYDPNGCTLWGTKIFGIDDQNPSINLAIDTNNNIIITGNYKSILNFYDWKNALVKNLCQPDVVGSFVAKYDCNGNLIWANPIISEGVIISNAVAVDITNNIFVVGNYYGGSATFVNTDGTVGSHLSKSVINDSFVVKYNSSGFVNWATKIGNYISQPDSGTNIGTGIDIFPDGSIAVVGTFTSGRVFFFGLTSSDTNIFSENTFLCNGEANICNESGRPTNITTNRTTDIFVAKYSTLGKIIWSAKITGALNENNASVAVDNTGSVLVVGNYSSRLLIVHSTTNKIMNNVPNVLGNNLSNRSTNNTSNASINNISNTSINNISNTSVRNVSNTSINNVSNTSINNVSNASINNISNASINNISNTSINNVSNRSTNNISGTTSTLSRTVELSNDDSKNIFIAKYNSNGIVLWATKISDVLFNNKSGLAVDSYRNILVTGKFTNDQVIFYDRRLSDFNADIQVQPQQPINVQARNQVGLNRRRNVFRNDRFRNRENIQQRRAATITNYGQTTSFVVQYGPNGRLHWTAKQSGNLVGNNFPVSVDNQNNVLVAGHYADIGTVRIFNSDNCLAKILPNSGFMNVFVAKYANYRQIILLDSPTFPIVKTIILESYTGTNTLILILNNILVDTIIGRKIKGILLTAPAATIVIQWIDGFWNILSVRDVIFIYAYQFEIN